jgi:predicted kinase
LLPARRSALLGHPGRVPGAGAQNLGTNVILGYGFWARAEREDYRLRARRLGTAGEVHYLDVPADELLLCLLPYREPPSKGGLAFS